MGAEDDTDDARQDSRAFDWGSYLMSSLASAAPVSCFTHVCSCPVIGCTVTMPLSLLACALSLLTVTLRMCNLFSY